MNSKAENFDKLMRMIQRSAEKGAALAQYYMGRFYSEGMGYEEDKKEAFKWYKLAAEQGHPWSQFELGMMYYYGTCVEKDLAVAIRWLKRASIQDDEWADDVLDALDAQGMM